ncbi:MAG: hypothetical protein ACRCYR_03725 [Phycicoccus sp.]
MLSRDSSDQPHWGHTEELTAQLLEEVSLLVSNYTRKEPITVTRPFKTTPTTAAPAPGVTEGSDGAATAVGAEAMIQLAVGSGHLLGGAA